MVGGAAEKVILNIRDAIADRLISLDRVPLPKGIEAEEWRIKSVTDAVRKFFDEHKGKKAGQLGVNWAEHSMAIGRLSHCKFVPRATTRDTLRASIP